MKWNVRATIKATETNPNARLARFVVPEEHAAHNTPPRGVYIGQDHFEGSGDTADAASADLADKLSDSIMETLELIAVLEERRDALRFAFRTAAGVEKPEGDKP